VGDEDRGDVDFGCSSAAIAQLFPHLGIERADGSSSSRMRGSIANARANAMR